MPSILYYIRTYIIIVVLLSSCSFSKKEEKSARAPIQVNEFVEKRKADANLFADYGLSFEVSIPEGFSIQYGEKGLVWLQKSHIAEITTTVEVDTLLRSQKKEGTEEILVNLFLIEGETENTEMQVFEEINERIWNSEKITFLEREDNEGIKRWVQGGELTIGGSYELEEFKNPYNNHTIKILYLIASRRFTANGLLSSSKDIFKNIEFYH